MEKGIGTPAERSFLLRTAFLLAGSLTVLLGQLPALEAGGFVHLSTAQFSSGPLDRVQIDPDSLTLLGRWDNTSPPLSIRYEMGFSYDPARNQSLVFGGHDHLDSTLGDTWLYDASSGWTQKNTSTAPAARYGHEMVWIGDKYLLFGGKNAQGQYLNDTWIYDVALNTWTYVVTASSPDARAYFAMAYSSAQAKVVLFGGQGPDGMTVPDFTWIFDVAASSWTKLAPSPHPSFRQGCSMAYDSLNQRVILFGGRENGWLEEDLFDDTWVFNAGSLTWEEKNPPSSPPARADAAMLFDAEHNQIVMFGGRNPQTFYLSDTYFYDYVKNRWLSFAVPTSPAGRYGHKMIYNTTSQDGHILGGKRDVASNVLWSYTLRSTGSWTSAAVSVPGQTPIDWDKISISFLNPPPPAQTRIDVQLASSADGAVYDAFRGPDGSTTTFYVMDSTSPQTIAAVHDNKHFLKIKAIFISSNIPARPHVAAIRLDYNQGPSEGVLKAPLHGALTNRLRPTFNWELSSDPDGVQDHPLLYHLEVAQSSSFASPAISVENIPKNDFDVSYTLTSDLWQTTWYWRVRAKDNVGLYGDWGTPFRLIIDTTTPPSPVTRIAAAKGPGNGQITLTWTFPGDLAGLLRLDNGTARTRFSTQGPILNETDWNSAPAERSTVFSANPGSVLQTTITGLADGTTYFFAIKTVNNFNNASVVSTTSPFAVTNAPPRPVTQMSAAKGPGNSQITLTWVFPGDDTERLEEGKAYIHFSTQGAILTEDDWNSAQEVVINPFGADPGQVISSQIGSLQAGTTYCFSVKVEDQEGFRSNLPATSPCTVSNAPPNPVTHMTAAMGDNNGAVHLTWTFPGDDDGRVDNGTFVIRFSTRSAILSEADWNAAEGERTGRFSAAPSNFITSAVTGLAQGTTYFFSIKTEDAMGGRSLLSTVSPSAMTNAPPSVQLLAPREGGPMAQIVPITWAISDPNGETNVIPSLWLSTDGGNTFPISISGGLPFGTTFYNWSTQGVPNGRMYRIQVKAVDQRGLSETDASTGNLIKEGFNDPPQVSFTLFPHAGARITGNFPLAWEVSNPSPYITYQYKLFVSSDAGSVFTQIFSGTQTAAMFDTTVWPNLNSYQLKIVATDSGEPPLVGTAVTGVFGINNPRAPGAFRLLRPLQNDFPSVFNFAFSWQEAVDPNGDAVVYTLRYSTDEAMGQSVIVPSLTQTEYGLSPVSLLLDTTYYWDVTARDPSALEYRSLPGQFMVSRTRVKSLDRFFLVEAISGLDTNGFVTIQDARATHAELIDRGNQDAVGDRLIKILSYPTWEIQIKDINNNPLPSGDVALKLSFNMGSGNQAPAQNSGVDTVQRLKIAVLNTSRSRWEIVPTQQVFATTQELHAFAQGVAVFSVVGAAEPSKNISGLTNFPNPFSPANEETRIRYILTEDAKVTIRIYTLFGDLIRLMNYAAGAAGGVGTPLGFTNEVRWDGKNGDGAIVANGVYLAEVRAESASGTSREIRRIGVLK